MERLKSTLEDTASHWVGTQCMDSSTIHWHTAGTPQMVANSSNYKWCKKKCLGILCTLISTERCVQILYRCTTPGCPLEANKPYLTRPLCYLVNPATVVSTISWPEHWSLLRKLTKWMETDALGYLPVGKQQRWIVMHIPYVVNAYGKRGSQSCLCLLNHVLKGTIFIIFGIA